jgi:hypothetical protein
MAVPFMILFCIIKHSLNNTSISDRLPNGDNFELNILAAIGPHIFWIEAKSGNYQQHVAKYSRFARLLGLDFDHAFIVLTDVSDERCDALSSLSFP